MKTQKQGHLLKAMEKSELNKKSLFDTVFQDKFDLAIKLVIGEKIETTNDTYLRNRLTLLLYKMEHKEMLTEFETIVLIEMSVNLFKGLVNGERGQLCQRKNKLK